ncbi:hypothetical protein swp_3623 [Shewanella piezotolerans WP3]|uniref:Uncharacterized protein n=1 Tax=Shewanella piezotolerans (strain WP3 / JCM 13877) TaxID=225849 RepID=B8CS23_SHEPW|nr:hypothetical protein [Shewanella piezotolerans]ACJ30313.1 hypothetical protein swp_3623 [Shewanella piezotolerans WP3]
MTNKLLLWSLVCVGLCLIGLIIFFDSNQVEEAEGINNPALESLSSESLAAYKAIEDTAPATKLRATTAVQAIPQQASDKARKSFDDAWCNAVKELSPEDIILAESQVADWDEYQGRASMKSASEINLDDANHPNNSFVVSYQELPKAELKELASAGDKWAMVTLVQEAYGDKEFKYQIAKQLLVEGASYYALEYLVIQELSAAKSSYRRSGDTKEATDHIISALTYAFWGVENYNIAGLSTYLGVSSRGYFDGYIGPDVVLAHSSELVKQRYNQLSTWVESEREILGITASQPSKGAINNFALNVAIRRNMHPERVEHLSEFNVTENDRLSSTPCVSEFMVSLSQD